MSGNVVNFPQRDPTQLTCQRLANAGMSFEAWVEVNADRIWELFIVSNDRDISFNELAAKLWRQVA